MRHRQFYYFVSFIGDNMVVGNTTVQMQKKIIAENFVSSYQKLHEYISGLEGVKNPVIINIQLIDEK